MERFVQSFACVFLSPVGMIRAISYCKTPVLRSYCRCRSFLACSMRVQRQSAAFIHTSVVCHVSNPRNTKKKIVKPVLYKPKSNKMLRDVVSIWPNMTVADLADVLNKDIDSVFEALLFVENGVQYDSPQSVIDDLNVTKQIVDKMGLRWMIQAKKTTNETVEEIDKDVYKRPPADPADLIKRPPVVTIMGHVDHGKTTLLDALRQTNVVATEFGGITQHIGAFSVLLSSGEKITFLDTPGHAAFSAMRARGAMVTDIVVLVVAADDGVMKQTIESIRYAKEAGVAIIVAINKIDKPEADIERTKKMLLEHNIQLEDFGGDIQSVSISALKATNLDALQESILALAEMLECRADPRGPVEATVIESKTDPGRGKLSTALIQRGTLRKGAYLVAGTAWAKVRGMFNDKGRPVPEAPPGTPVEVIGWRELPSAGDEVLEVDSEQMAKEVVSWRQQCQLEKKTVDDLEIIRKKSELHDLDYQRKRQERLERGYRGGSIYRAIRNKETLESSTGPQLGIVIKGDVDGSLEAILDVLETYNSPQCQLDVLNYGVGVICEYDVEMAAAFNGVVYGFNVTVADKVAALAKSKRVNIKLHNVIYRLIADIKERLTERLAPVDVEEVIGEANVQAQFMVTDGKRKLNVAGCRCVKGILLRKGLFKLVRGGEVLVTGELSTLKHFKNDVDSIKMDVECGLSFADQSVVPQPGDTVVCFEFKKKKQEIKWDLEF